VPRDMVACEQTSQLYVADDWECVWLYLANPECVWRVSVDEHKALVVKSAVMVTTVTDIKRWWSKSSSDTFIPRTLSVTSTRLLVTSDYTNQLLQLDAGGDELRRVQLPDDMTDLQHAVESPTGTFIISHHNTQLKQDQVSEVNTDGKVLRQFTGSRLSLGFTPHVAIDSHGNIFLADYHNRHILLLDAQLTPRRVIVDQHQLNYKSPWRLCYREPTGQLLVGLDEQNSVLVFDVLRR